jgi:hypothetical protein
MALFQCVAQLIVKVGHANVQQRIGALGRPAHLAVLLEAIPTADSAMLVEIGNPDRCRVP